MILQVPQKLSKNFRRKFLIFKPCQGQKVSRGPLLRLFPTMHISVSADIPNFWVISGRSIWTTIYPPSVSDLGGEGGINSMNSPDRVVKLSWKIFRFRSILNSLPVIIQQENFLNITGQLYLIKYSSSIRSNDGKRIHVPRNVGYRYSSTW